MSDKFGFERVINNIYAVKKELPVVLANQAQRFFADSWKQQGWEGVEWKTPNRRIPGTKEYKYPKFKGLGRRTRATLVQSGRLRREVNNSIRSATLDRIQLTVSAPYALFNNEGTAKLPKRQFMGDSQLLRDKQKETITKFIDRIWQA